MSNTDLVTMIGHLSQSLFPVQNLIAGGGYLIGLTLVVTSLGKFRKLAAPSSREQLISPLAYLFAGMALIFLPTALTILSNTAFGSGNILEYPGYNPYDIFSAMGVLIRTAGLIWFVRGCVLLADSGEPGAKGGSKGFVFLIAGICAINFKGTTFMLNYIMQMLSTGKS